MQVSAHLAALLDARNKHHVIPVVGGMSEQKQRRLLGREPAIVVATPGRLWELINARVPHISDLTALRFLVIDEADRMVEQGSFPELEKLLDLIQRLDKSADAAALDLHKQTTDTIDEADADDADGASEADSDDDASSDDGAFAGEVPVEMLDEALLRRIQEQAAGVSADGPAEAVDEAVDEDARMPARETDAAQDRERVVPSRVAASSPRQTLVFSATLMLAPGTAKSGASRRHHGPALKRGARANEDQPIVQRILDKVGLRGEPTVIDMGNSTSDAAVPDAVASSDAGHAAAGAPPPAPAQHGTKPQSMLPSTLKLVELRTVATLKSAHLYRFLSVARGRTLVFVNSINAVRRLALLLEVLQIKAGALHARMQQRQRLKSLDRFKCDASAPEHTPVLVATDVAARGLHVSGVQFVVHYDLPRTTQVFVHRAGRTARAAASGTSLSLVSPQDEPSHKTICAELGTRYGRSTFEKHAFEQRVLQRARERVVLAEQITRAAEDSSRGGKREDWFRKNAAEADLELDDDLRESAATQDRAAKHNLARAKAQLSALLKKKI